MNRVQLSGPSVYRAGRRQRTCSLGIAPLHLASLHGHTTIVEILLNAGADMDAEVKALDEDTYTPYEITRLVHHREI